MLQLTCLLAVALATPHHAAGHHAQHDAEEKPAVPEKAEAKPEEVKPAAEEKKSEESPAEHEKESEPIKAAEAAKPEDADAGKKEDAAAVPAEAHADDKVVKHWTLRSPHHDC